MKSKETNISSKSLSEIKKIVDNQDLAVARIFMNIVDYQDLVIKKSISLE